MIEIFCSATVLITASGLKRGMAWTLAPNTMGINTLAVKPNTWNGGRMFKKRCPDSNFRESIVSMQLV